jgi:hypothetical protein
MKRTTVEKRLSACIPAAVRTVAFSFCFRLHQCFAVFSGPEKLPLKVLTGKTAL